MKGPWSVFDDLVFSLERASHVHSALTCFYRGPDKLNLGRAFNFLANTMASLSAKTAIADVKGDGINVFKIANFVDDYTDALFALSDDNFYFWDLLQAASYNREPLLFVWA